MQEILPSVSTVPLDTPVRNSNAWCRIYEIFKPKCYYDIVVLSGEVITSKLPGQIKENSSFIFVEKIPEKSTFGPHAIKFLL